MKLTINTYIDLTEDASAWTAFRPKPQPAEGYSAEDDVELAFPDGMELQEKSVCLVITDKRSTLESFPQGIPITLHTVYCGEASDVEDLIDRIDEIWGARESGRVRQKRLRTTVYALKHDYDAFLYENLLTTMNDSVPDMVWYKDIHGTHWRVNKAFCETVQKTKDDCRGKSHGYIWGVPEEEGFACQESEKAVIQAGTTCTFDEPVKTTAGLRQFVTYKTPIKNRYGDITGTTGVGHDVTSLSNMGIELSILIENIPLPILLCSTEWKTMRYNAQFREVAELDAEQMVSFNYQDWKADALEAASEPVADEEEHSIRQELRKKQGNGYYVTIEQEIRDFFDNLTGYFVIFRDITLQRDYEANILKAANTDALTSLYNRRYFYDYIRSIGGKPATLLYMDLDRFKEVNDSLGHAKGDEVLRGTADFIRECFPEGVAARLGGDEFALLIDRPLEEAELEKECRLLEEKVLSLFPRHEKGDLFVTISVGIVSTDGSDGGCFDPDAFIHQADEKMYEVKKRHHQTELS